MILKLWIQFWICFFLPMKVVTTFFCDISSIIKFFILLFIQQYFVSFLCLSLLIIKTPLHSMVPKKRTPTIEIVWVYFLILFILAINFAFAIDFCLVFLFINGNIFWNHYRTIRELYIITCMWHSLCSTAQNHRSKYDMWMAVKHKKAIYTRTTHQIIPYFFFIFYYTSEKLFIYLARSGVILFTMELVYLMRMIEKRTLQSILISRTPLVFLFVYKNSPQVLTDEITWWKIHW